MLSSSVGLVIRLAPIIPIIIYMSVIHTAGCVVPASPMNGDWQTFSPSEVVTPGTNISLSCNLAYQPSGMMSSTCQSDGSWDPDTADLTCIEGIVGPCIFIIIMRYIRVQYTVCAFACNCNINLHNPPLTQLTVNDIILPVFYRFCCSYCDDISARPHLHQSHLHSAQWYPGC